MKNTSSRTRNQVNSSPAREEGKKSTRETILLTTLKMLNQSGSASVTTNHIADELGLSPANIYYYFKNKEEIILEIFQMMKSEVEEALSEYSREKPLRPEDMMKILNLLSNIFWDYRFCFRDLNVLIMKDENLSRHVKDMIRRRQQTIGMVIDSYCQQGLLDNLSKDIRDELITNIWIILSGWHSYLDMMGTRVTRKSILQGVQQVASIISPHLTAAGKKELKPYMKPAGVS